MTTRGRRLTLYLADEDESESNDIRVNEMKVWGHREVIQRLHSIGTVQDEIYQLETDSLLGPPVLHKKICFDVKDEASGRSSDESMGLEASPIKDIHNSDTLPRNKSFSEKDCSFAMNEINHLLNLHPDSTATDERTDNESESFSCSLNESKSEAESFTTTRGRNDEDTLTLSVSDKQNSGQILQAIVSESKSEETECRSLPKSTFESENTQQFSESEKLAHCSASETSVAGKPIALSLDSSTRCEAFEKTREIQKNPPQANKKVAVQIQFIVNESPKFSIRKMKKMMRKWRKGKFFGRKWKNQYPKIMRKRKKKYGAGKAIISSTLSVRNEEAKQVENAKLDESSSYNVNLQDENGKQPHSFYEAMAPQEGSPVQNTEDPQGLSELSPTFEVVKSAEETIVQTSTVPENLHEETSQQEPQRPLEAVSETIVKSPLSENTKYDTCSQMFNLSNSPQAPDSTNDSNSPQAPDSTNDSNSPIEVDGKILEFATLQNEPPLDSPIKMSSRGTRGRRKKPLNLSSVTASGVPANHSNSVENSVLPSNGFNHPTSVSSAIKNVSDSRRRKGKIDENGIPVKAARISRRVKQSSLPDEPSFKQKYLDGEEYKDDFTPSKTGSHLKLPESTSKTKAQTKNNRLKRNATKIDVKSQVDENLDPILKSDLPNGIPERCHPTETHSEILPELSSLTFENTLPFGSIVEDTELLSSCKEQDANEVEKEVSSKSVPTCNPEVMDRATLFSVNLMTQHYLIHEILPCICDQPQTANSEKADPILPDSCLNKENGNVAFSFCLNCTIFEEAITFEKVDMFHCGSAFVCSICNFETTKKAFLLDHVAYRHAKVVFQCPSCEFHAQFAVLLKHHWDQTHPDITLLA